MIATIKYTEEELKKVITQMLLSKGHTVKEVRVITKIAEFGIETQITKKAILDKVEVDIELDTTKSYPTFGERNSQWGDH
jgi:hypothetical protein